LGLPTSEFSYPWYRYKNLEYGAWSPNSFYKYTFQIFEKKPLPHKNWGTFETNRYSVVWETEIV